MLQHYRKYIYLAIAIAVGLTLYRFSPTAYWFWPKCPFKLITGLNCPACGIQRFIHAFTNGHFTEALAYNYFLVYALPYAFCLVVAYYLPDCRLKRRMQDIFEGRTAVGIYIATFSVWLVARNILGI